MVHAIVCTPKLVTAQSIEATLQDGVGIENLTHMQCMSMANNRSSFFYIIHIQRGHWPNSWSKANRQNIKRLKATGKESVLFRELYVAPGAEESCICAPASSIEFDPKGFMT